MTSSPDNTVDPLAQLLIADPHTVRVLGSMRELDFWSLRRSPYIALIGAILGQKIRYTAAKQLRSQFYSLLDQCNYDWNTTPHIDLVEWCLHQLTGVPNFIRNVINNLQTWLRHNPDFSFTYNLDQLEQIDGIGKWTLCTVRLVAMNHCLDKGPTHWMGLYPPKDVFLRGRIQKMYQLGVAPTESEVAAIVARWGQFAGVMTWYLWRWFDDNTYVPISESAVSHLPHLISPQLSPPNNFITGSKNVPSTNCPDW